MDLKYMVRCFVGFCLLILASPLFAAQVRSNIIPAGMSILLPAPAQPLMPGESVLKEIPEQGNYSLYLVAMLLDPNHPHGGPLFAHIRLEYQRKFVDNKEEFIGSISCDRARIDSSIPDGAYKIILKIPGVPDKACVKGGDFNVSYVQGASDPRRDLTVEFRKEPVKQGAKGQYRGQ